jgi:hypothetical protein
MLLPVRTCFLKEYRLQRRQDTAGYLKKTTAFIMDTFLLLVRLLLVGAILEALHTTLTALGVSPPSSTIETCHLLHTSNLAKVATIILGQKAAALSDVVKKVEASKYTCEIDPCLAHSQSVL